MKAGFTRELDERLGEQSKGLNSPSENKNASEGRFSRSTSAAEWIPRFERYEDDDFEKFEGPPVSE